MIYIDPPYNTKELQNYKDKFQRHGWLSMLKERLVLAKKLLAETGAVFVSIDDHEQAYLKVLMDEIFGEENFITVFSYISNKKGRQTNDNIATCCEYILLYSLNKSLFNINDIDTKYIQKLMPNIYEPKNYEVLKDKYGEYVIKNELKQTNIRKYGVHARPNLRYPIYVHKTNNKEIKTNIIFFNKNDYFEI